MLLILAAQGFKDRHHACSRIIFNRDNHEFAGHKEIQKNQQRVQTA